MFPSGFLACMCQVLFLFDGWGRVETDARQATRKHPSQARLYYTEPFRHRQAMPVLFPFRFLAVGIHCVSGNHPSETPFRDAAASACTGKRRALV